MFRRLPQEVSQRTSEALVKVWATLCVVAGSVSAIELMQQQSFLGDFFNFTQHWAVFRATSFLGHPLANAWFFAGSAPYFLHKTLTSSRKFALPTICSGLGVYCSASTSGLVALLVGGGLALIATLARSRTGANAKLAVFISFGAGVYVLLNSPVLSARSSSQDGLSSSAYRDNLGELVWGLRIDSVFFGVGAGRSGVVFSASNPLPLESAWLGSFISLGLVGFAALAFFLLSQMLYSLRMGQYGVSAAILSWSIMGAAFPAWEYAPCVLVFFALANMLTNQRVLSQTNSPSEVKK
jgi:hypothetical protein